MSTHVTVCKAVNRSARRGKQILDLPVPCIPRTKKPVRHQVVPSLVFLRTVLVSPVRDCRQVQRHRTPLVYIQRVSKGMGGLYVVPVNVERPYLVVERIHGLGRSGHSCGLTRLEPFILGRAGRLMLDGTV